MDIDAKMTGIHSVAAIITAYISFILSNGSIAAVGPNQALGTFAGLIILIVTGRISERVLGKENVNGFSGWLWSGIVPFAFVWFMVWAMLITTATY